MNTHKFVEIKLWNRTKTRSELLKSKLVNLAPTTMSPNVVVTVHDSVEECCKDCDVIVTATSTSTPLVFKRFLKPNVHINGTYMFGLNRTLSLSFHIIIPRFQLLEQDVLITLSLPRMFTINAVFTSTIGLAQRLNWRR